RHFGSPRYDTRYLVHRLIRQSEGVEIGVGETEADFNRTDPRREALAGVLAERFGTSVLDVPTLFPETSEALQRLRERDRYLFALYSEASPSRFQRIVEVYELARSMDVRVNGSKSLEGWQRVLQLCRDALPRESLSVDQTIYVVGDSLRADIAPGN